MFRKVIVTALAVASIGLVPFSAHAQLTEKALLEKYADRQHVKPEDNKIGLTIEKISNEKGNIFFIHWKSTSDLVMERGQMLTASLLCFIDAENPGNAAAGLESTFRLDAGEVLGSANKMVVTLDKPARFIIIYFGGIDASIKNSEKIRTPPMFFMAELGDKPKLLDPVPRYADSLFKQAAEERREKLKKKEKGK